MWPEQSRRCAAGYAAVRDLFEEVLREAVWQSDRPATKAST